MNWLQHNAWHSYVEIRLGVSLIVLAIVWYLVRAVWRHQHQAAWLKSDVRAHEIKVVQRNLDRLFFLQLGLASGAALSFLVLTWIIWWPFLSGALLLLMAGTFFWVERVRTMKWVAAKMPTDSPYRDTQVG